jgi:hypothetical protein
VSFSCDNASEVLGWLIAAFVIGSRILSALAKKKPAAQAPPPRAARPAAVAVPAVPRPPPEPEPEPEAFGRDLEPPVAEDVIDESVTEVVDEQVSEAPPPAWGEDLELDASPASVEAAVLARLRALEAQGELDPRDVEHLARWRPAPAARARQPAAAEGDESLPAALREAVLLDAILTPRRLGGRRRR